jgi:hypothetical protein
MMKTYHNFFAQIKIKNIKTIKNISKLIGMLGLGMMTG